MVEDDDDDVCHIPKFKPKLSYFGIVAVELRHMSKKDVAKVGQLFDI